MENTLYTTLVDLTSANKIYLIELIGYLAAFFSTISFIPQVLKIWRDKSATAISTAMYLLYSIGIIFWFIYGIMINSLPLIVTEIIMLILTLAILVMKYLWK